MKYLKLFENFDNEFLFFLQDKLIELSDDGLQVDVYDKTSKPDMICRFPQLLENMINIWIHNKEKTGVSNNITLPFNFSRVSDFLADILLSNNDWIKTETESGEIKTEPLYKQTHIFVHIPNKTYLISEPRQRTDTEGKRGERISWKMEDGNIRWFFDNPKALGKKTLLTTGGNPLNLVCKSVEIFFE